MSITAPVSRGFYQRKSGFLYKDETGEVVPAIVSEEIWEKANAVFHERSTAIKTRGRSFKDKSVFTGKIWCKSHDKPYWRTSYSNSASKGKPIYQWVCSEKKRFGAKQCASFAIMEDDLYKMLSEHFQSIAILTSMLRISCVFTVKASEMSIFSAR